MTDQTDGVWRDEERLPVSELSRAMASSDTDGQHDDVTGNDAGSELAFGHDVQAETGTDAEVDDPYRNVRPSTTGRTGPH
jgi:hypothetical protein